MTSNNYSLFHNRTQVQDQIEEAKFIGSYLIAWRVYTEAEMKATKPEPEKQYYLINGEGRETWRKGQEEQAMLQGKLSHE